MILFLLNTSIGSSGWWSNYERDGSEEQIWLFHKQWVQDTQIIISQFSRWYFWFIRIGTIWLIVFETTKSLSNESIKRISISIISNSSIILEQTNSLTSPNDNGFNWIPSSVSDGMSKSNSIINQHSPMSLCLYYRNCHHLLWLGSEKEDLINQSSLSFILLIVNFGSTVSS